MMSMMCFQPRTSRHNMYSSAEVRDKPGFGGKSRTSLSCSTKSLKSPDEALRIRTEQAYIAWIKRHNKRHPAEMEDGRVRD